MQPILRKQLSGPLSVSRFRVEIRQREPIAIGRTSCPAISGVMTMPSKLSAPKHPARTNLSRRFEIATRATWGEPPGHKARLRQMALLEWRPVRKNTLLGFCSIELPNGLQIDDIAVHVRGGKAWVSFPARPMLDADGRQVMRDGRPQYISMMRWQSRDLADRFSAALVELVRNAYPDAFDDVHKPAAVLLFDAAADQIHRCHPAKAAKTDI